MIRCIFTFCLFIAATALPAQNKVRKAIFIIADGIPVDVIQKLDLPNFKKIAGCGWLCQSSCRG